MKYEPKVGDRVKLLSPHDRDERSWVGHVGTIVEEADPKSTGYYPECRRAFKPDDEELFQQWIGEKAIWQLITPASQPTMKLPNTIINELSGQLELEVPHLTESVPLAAVGIATAIYLDQLAVATVVGEALAGAGRIIAATRQYHYPDITLT